MKPEEIFAVLKLDDCPEEVNREKISICYNECYKRGDQLLSKYLFTASVRLCTCSFS
jgi:hypothetical protein